MANVRLFRDGEKEINGLPRVCMRCGAPATRTRSINFQDTIWRQQRVAVPLCEKHRYYAHLYRVFSRAGGGALPVLYALQMWFGAKTQLFLVFLISGLFLLFTVIGFVIGRVLRNPIRPERITDTCIELTRVAPQFVAAVVNEWEVFRQHFGDVRERLDAATSKDERIIPSGHDIYRAKSLT